MIHLKTIHFVIFVAALQISSIPSSCVALVQSSKPNAKKQSSTTLQSKSVKQTTPKDVNEYIGLCGYDDVNDPTGRLLLEKLGARNYATAQAHGINIIRVRRKNYYFAKQLILDNHWEKKLRLTPAK